MVSSSDVTIRFPPSPDFSAALLSFQKRNLFCDATLCFTLSDKIELVGEKNPAEDGRLSANIPAHRVVLAAASPFLRNVVESTEGPVSRILVPLPVKEKTMKTIVEWIYGSPVEVAPSEDLLSELLAVADSLRLFSLAETARKFVGDLQRSEEERTSNPADVVSAPVETESPEIVVKEENDADWLEEKLEDNNDNNEKFAAEGTRPKRRSKSSSKDNDLWEYEPIVKKRGRKKKKLGKAEPEVMKETGRADEEDVVLQDPVLSQHVDDSFIFRCPECDAVIERDDGGAASRRKVFPRRCAKHLWTEHRILCPSVYKRCRESDCDYAACSVSSVEAHVKLKHRGKKISGKISQENSVEKHDSVSNESKKSHSCLACGKTFSRKHFLTLHETAVHDGGDGAKHDCPHCDYYTPYKPMIVQHVFLKHGVVLPGCKILTCEICGTYQTPLLKLLNRHKKRKCLAEEKRIPCEECGKTFRSGYEVKMHRKRLHEGADVGMCPNCGEVFRSKSGLKYHLWRVHRQGSNGTAPEDVMFRLEKPFRCAYCPHTSGLSGNCRKHVMRSHPGLEVKYVDLRKVNLVDAGITTAKEEAVEISPTPVDASNASTFVAVAPTTALGPPTWHLPPGTIVAAVFNPCPQ